MPNISTIQNLIDIYLFFSIPGFMAFLKLSTSTCIFLTTMLFLFMMKEAYQKQVS
jgi:hypothetical protein